jgi:hypothetical protein
VAEIDACLADPKLYVRDPAEAARLTQRRARLAERLAQAETVWIHAAEAYEAVR